MRICKIRLDFIKGVGREMAKAYKINQLTLTMPDRVGLLNEITKALAGANINITAVRAHGIAGNAEFMLLTDDNDKARDALTSSGFDVGEEAAVAVELINQPGELQSVASKIAEAGININYSYGTTGVGEYAICIFKTSDDDKTIEVVGE